jgi:tetratricopeptide (TPR) repeat protein
MNRKFISIVLMMVLIFSSSAVFSQDLGKIAASNLSAAKGESLFKANRYDEAVVPLENAIKIRPEHGRAHYYLALTYEKLGEKRKAISFLESYLAYISQTQEWVGDMDKEYIAKCKQLHIELMKTYLEEVSRP